MFYLKLLFRFIRNHPFKNLLFFACSTLLVASPFFQGDLENSVLNLLPYSAQGDSFHALISSDVNVARVGRKLRTLPGVYQVISLGEREVTAQVKQLMNKLDVNSSLLEGININSAGLNVIYKKGINTRVKNLIRDYLLKFVGPDKVTLGAIVERNDSLTWMDNARSYFERWGFGAIFVGITLLWFGGLRLWSKELLSEVNLVQAYQRRKNIAFKLYILVALAFVIEICVLIVGKNFQIEWAYLVTCLLLFFLGAIPCMSFRVRSI